MDIHLDDMRGIRGLEAQGRDLADLPAPSCCSSSLVLRSDQYLLLALSIPRPRNKKMPSSEVEISGTWNSHHDVSRIFHAKAVEVSSIQTFEILGLKAVLNSWFH